MKKCIQCGKEYAGRNKNTCSVACWAECRKQYKACVCCGKTFQDAQSNMRTTCSMECSRNHRKGMHADGKYIGSYEQAAKAMLANPMLQPDEAHVNATGWVIMSPGGKTYSCRNLKHWLRGHEDMIDGTVKQAWDGISKIKYSIQGKRKNPCYQWKGWRMISWSDD